MTGHIVVAALWLAALSGCAQAGPVVATAQGRVEGVIEREVAVFKGLPFAQPPTGPLRWRAPREPIAWSGTRDGSRFASPCVQNRAVSLEGGGDPGPVSEDCLYLNVWTPQADTTTPRPVMVWLHGGALVFGASHLPVYDASALARRGVVVVTINYRLGPLGFMVHPALERESGGAVAAANFGLLDQIAALRWVRDNIASFGGDPLRVTIFGQSAGAQSVLALMASPPAQGLFQQAIAQSAYGIPSHTRDKARGVGVSLAQAVGLPGAQASAARLRAVPAERFIAVAGPTSTLAPSFVVGDAAMPRTIVSAFRARQQAALPLVIGSNSDETSVAAAFGIRTDALVRQLGAGKLFVQPHYPDVHDDAELGRQVVSDAVFAAYARRIAVLHAARAPVWRYYFSRKPAGVAATAKGVTHGGEVPAVFESGDLCGCLPAPATEDDRRAARDVADRWAAFAATGTPDVGSPPAWPRDGRLLAKVLEFGDQTTVREEFMRQRLDAFIGAGNLLDAALR
jgi:para-nitrobenzyl esterase